MALNTNQSGQLRLPDFNSSGVTLYHTIPNFNDRIKRSPLKKMWEKEKNTIKSINQSGKLKLPDFKSSRIFHHTIPTFNDRLKDAF